MKIILNKNNPNYFINNLQSVTKNKKVLFSCIGTDRSTGDSLGPLIGSELELLGYNVIGTLDNPLHAINLSERMAEVKQMDYNLIIAIDACLGRIDCIGDIYLKDVPLKPGSGVGKDLTGVGNYSIIGIVNIGGYMEYQVLQSTRLSIVMNMSKSIINAIKIAIPLEENVPELIHYKSKELLLWKLKSIFNVLKVKLA